MAAELANYFISKKYDPEKITILTTYRRQLSRILKAVSNKSAKFILEQQEFTKTWLSTLRPPRDAKMINKH